MEAIPVRSNPDPDPGHAMNEHAAIVKAEDLPSGAQELTSEQRAMLDTALRALFAKHALQGSDIVLGNKHLGYCQKILDLYALQVWAWHMQANELLHDAMRLLPPYLHVYVQRKAQKLIIDCFTAG
jgi:hypothetical protein